MPCWFVGATIIELKQGVNGRDEEEPRRVNGLGDYNSLVTSICREEGKVQKAKFAGWGSR